MRGPAAAVQADGVAGDAQAADVDRVLADFRDWLREFAEPAAAPAAPPFDLFALVGQLAALRHDVSLQTKAARAMTEQIAARESAAKPAVDVRPLVKAIIDVADALGAAHAQVSKLAAADDTPVPSAPDEFLAVANARPKTQGFFAKLFAPPPPDSGPIHDWLAAVAAAEEKRAVERKALVDRLAGVADGYAMSLRRVERVLPQFGLEPVACVGKPFDPETMEAVELVAGAEAGVVVQEVRRGYRWDGKPFRPALVTVAR